MTRIFLILFFLIPTFAKANLLITPSRLVLDENNRSGEITLLNNTTTTKTYKIILVEKKQTENGTYIELEKADIEDFSASSMLLYSPRKVTILPGKYQKIKLRTKLPRDLSPGEYRSHLMMKVVDSEIELPANDASTRGINVFIIPQVSFSIPIIIRKGTNDSKTSITAIELATDEKKSKYLAVDIEHSGHYSSYGSLFAYMKVGNGPVTQIGRSDNVALFRETSLRHTKLPLQEQNIPKGAVIQVLYKGDSEYDGQILGKAAIRYD